MVGGQVVNNGKDIRSIINNPEARQFLKELLGDEGLDVIQVMSGSGIVDEEIAERTGLKLNLVRKILYKLYDHRLASYIRTKDPEIGWYIYTWSLDLSRVFEIIQARKRKILEELNKRLEFEQNHVFFCCKMDDAKVPFDIASKNDFKCPQCGCIMDYMDNQQSIMSLQHEIGRLEREIQHVRQHVPHV